MPIAIWNDSLATGIGRFDEDHKHLLNLLNAVYEDFITDAPAESVERVLDELMDYTRYHFAAEEAWLQKITYPGLAEHRLEHERFVQRVLEIREEYHDGIGRLNVDMLSFLKEWLTGHILKTDAAYGIAGI